MREAQSIRVLEDSILCANAKEDAVGEIGHPRLKVRASAPPDLAQPAFSMVRRSSGRIHRHAKMHVDDSDSVKCGSESTPWSGVSSVHPSNNTIPLFGATPSTGAEQCMIIKSLLLD